MRGQNIDVLLQIRSQNNILIGSFCTFRHISTPTQTGIRILSQKCVLKMRRLFNEIL